MTCPDADALVDLTAGIRVTAELLAHVETCQSCQMDCWIIDQIRTSCESLENMPAVRAHDIMLRGAPPILA